MIVECPNCQAKFRLPDEKIGPQGSKLRCGKCRHVFTVEPPEPAVPPEAGGLTDFDFPDDMAPPPDAPPAPRAPAPEGPKTEGDADAPPDLFHSESYDSKEEADEEPLDEGPPKPGFSLDDVADIPLPGSRPSTDRRRRLLIIAASLLFVVVVAGFAIYFLDLMPGKKSAHAPQTPPAATAPAKPEKSAPAAPAEPEKAPPAEAAKPAAPAAGASEPAQKPEDAAKVKEITLQNIRQYYVSNEKAGQLFVIEGEAVNKFKTPKEMIKLEATLFDEKGASLASQEVLSGNRVSLFQLQVMTRDELKNALTSQVGVLTNNTNIPTDGVTPFMIVFFDPPDTVKEYGIKVVDAKDPPRQ